MKSAFLIATSAALLSTTVMGIVGCSDPPPPPRFAVSGHVTLNRRPLSDAVIRFVAKQREGDVTATIHDGGFRIDQPVGPVAGDYDIIVTPITPELPAAMAAIEAGERDPLNTRVVPAKYQSPGALRATVTPNQENQFDFELRGR